MAVQPFPLQAPLTLRILAADPTTTPANHIDVYAKGTSIYSRTSGGTVTDLGSAAAGAPTYLSISKWLIGAD